MTPAEELRAAADKIRKLGAAATPGPWVAADGVIPYGHRVGTADQTDWVAWTGAVTEDRSAADAAYIAAMHPGVGNALAKWLWSWVGIDFREDAALPEDAMHALAVARAINATH